MATLSIGAWFSRCEECGGNADPYEETHANVTMQGDGCGATYTEVTASVYYPGLPERIKEMRPDLPYTGWEPPE